MELSESFSFFNVGLKDSNLELGSPNPRYTPTYDLRQNNSQFHNEGLLLRKLVAKEIVIRKGVQ
jgi:hypothetical protein